MLSTFELNAGIAALLGYEYSVLNQTVYLEQPVRKYGFDYHHEFNVIDGSLGSKALCFDLLTEYQATFYPKRQDDAEYRFGHAGPYARCGSHEPVVDECPEKAICMAILKTYSPDMGDHLK